MWRAIVRVLRSPLDSISSVLLPAVCRLCEQPLLHASRTPVCPDCWRLIQPQDPDNLCSLCGEQLGFGDLRFAVQARFPGQNLCEMCERARPPFAHAVAYGVYEGPLRAAIHLLKYENMTSCARPLGERLAVAIASLGSLSPETLVVPVPLHKAKRSERGFNQTVLLAEAALAALRRLWPHKRLRLAEGALMRTRRTESQAGLSPHQRRRNLRGAFQVPHPEQIAARPVLLIDDIYTTGATARECSRVLLAAGACSVSVATLARSQREGVAFWNPQSAGFAQRAQPATPGERVVY
jgi:ComF family protein